MTRTASPIKVDKYARTAPSLDEVAIEMALASFYDPTTGKSEASRVEIAETLHWSEKRVRTLTRNLAESGRWKVESRGNKAKTFTPLFA